MKLRTAIIPSHTSLLNTQFGRLVMLGSLFLTTACQEVNDPTFNDTSYPADNMLNNRVQDPYVEESDSMSDPIEETLQEPDLSCSQHEDCESEICIFLNENEPGYCAENCSAEDACENDFVCAPNTTQRLLCLPPDHPAIQSEIDIPDVQDTSGCELSPNKDFIYTVDNSLTIRRLNPITGEASPTGACEIPEMYGAVNRKITEFGFGDLVFDSSYTFGEKTFVTSLAVTRDGKGYIAFTTKIGYSHSAYGLIEVPSVNAIFECKTTVLGVERENFSILTVSAGQSSLDPQQESLFASLIFAEKMGRPYQDPTSPFYEERNPRLLMELNPNELFEQRPFMSVTDLTLSEMTQSNQGQLFSLYLEEGCYGDCRPSVPGLPQPAGVDITYLRLAAINPNTEVIEADYPINLEAPYEANCQDCEYSSTHNLAFFHHEAFLTHSLATSYGTVDNLSVSHLKTNSSQSRSHMVTKIIRLTFDPVTQSYNEAGAIEVDFPIHGAASFSCSSL